MTDDDTTSDDITYSIAEIAERTGLSKDTLRWYEQQGLIQGVDRDASGYRAYGERAVRLIELVIRLRRTGMPVRQARAFVAMVAEGAASHGRRMALLEEHRERVLEQLAQLNSDLQAIDSKIEHYARLIDNGRDCLGAAVTDQDLRARQGSRS